MRRAVRPAGPWGSAGRSGPDSMIDNSLMCNSPIFAAGCHDRADQLSPGLLRGMISVAAPQVRRPPHRAKTPRRMGQTTAHGEDVSA